MNFFECYSTLSQLNESKTEYQSFLNSFSTPKELLDWMKKNITYHLEIEDYDIEVPDERPTQSGEEIFSSKNGHCAEQSYLEKDVLENLGYKPKLVCVKENNSDQDYDYYGCTHVFVVYPENDKYVWFENAMHRETGIHEYNSLEELFTDFAKKWRKGEKESDTLEFRYIDEISGIGNAELAKKCHQYPIIFSADISNNKLEESLTESINYKRITDKAAFNTFRTHAHDAFGNSIIDDYSLEEDAGYMNEIYKNGQLIGYVGFSKYTGEADDDFDKALGIGNFIIIDKGKGLGSEVIRDIVDRYKDTFDLIYCFVDANNTGAIKLYRRLGTVHDEYGPNEKGEYYVVFYDKNDEQLSEDYTNSDSTKNIILSLSSDEILEKSNIAQVSKAPDGPSFILPNGNFITTANEEKYHNFIIAEIVNKITGSSLDGYYKEDDTDRIYDDILDYLIDALGWVKANSGSSFTENRSYIVIPRKSSNKLTNLQYYAIEEVLENIENENINSDVQIFAGESGIENKYSLRDNTPEDIVKKIRRYYSSGYFVEHILSEVYPNTGKKKDDLDNLRNAIQGAEEAAEIKVSDDSTMACGMEHHTIVNWLKELLARKTGSPFKKRYEVMTIPQAIEHIEKDIFPEADEETYAIHKELLDWLLELKELREKDTI